MDDTNFQSSKKNTPWQSHLPGPAASPRLCIPQGFLGIPAGLTFWLMKKGNSGSSQERNQYNMTYRSRGMRQKLVPFFKGTSHILTPAQKFDNRPWHCAMRCGGCTAAVQHDGDGASVNIGGGTVGAGASRGGGDAHFARITSLLGRRCVGLCCTLAALVGDGTVLHGMAAVRHDDDGASVDIGGGAGGAGASGGGGGCLLCLNHIMVGPQTCRLVLHVRSTGGCRRWQQQMRNWRRGYGNCFIRRRGQATDSPARAAPLGCWWLLVALAAVAAVASSGGGHSFGLAHIRLGR
jgi:hypothetical protein